MLSEFGQSARPDPSEPIGQGDHVVQPGECLLSIAQRAGRLWETLWNHRDNTELKRVRGNPAVLLPGDRVAIPARRLREVACATSNRHTFVRRGTPAKLSVRLLNEDGNPLRDEPYALDVDGTLRQGKLDRDGRLEVAIPADARRAALTLSCTNETIELVLGAVDPIDSWSGIQARLENLGFLVGDGSGQPRECTWRALSDFQQRYHLPITGEPDAATKDKLLEIHGS